MQRIQTCESLRKQLTKERNHSDIADTTVLDISLDSCSFQSGFMDLSQDYNQVPEKARRLIKIFFTFVRSIQGQQSSGKATDLRLS